MIRRPKSKAVTIVLIAIVVVAVGILGFSAYKLFGIQSSYNEAKNAYDKVENMFYEDDEDNPNTDPSKTEQENPESEPVEDQKEHDPGLYKTNSKWRWNYQKMLSICPDAVGYISLEGVLSYPVLQGETNDTYMRHMYDGTYNIAGSIYVDSGCKEALDTEYALVYGHNMDDNSMFAPLTDYSKEEYYRKHPTFDIYVKDRHYKYYVFSAFTADAAGPVYRIGFTGQQLVEQGEYLRDQALYKTGAPVITKNSHIVVLSTCVDYVNGYRDYSKRFVVCLVRGEEVD